VYTAKEIFFTQQGEGAQTGRHAVFLRFAGCNLWSGREKDRATAVCNFCDTDFVGTGPDGGKFAGADALADAVASCWSARQGSARQGSAQALSASSALHAHPYVVCTGGEPLLQLDSAAVDALHVHGFEVGVETNGTQIAPGGIDWICVSPKSDAPLLITRGNELKLVYPQLKAPPEKFAALSFDHFFLQPMDGPHLAENTRAAAEYCLANPQWRLSLQTHKLLGLR
jgi:7-carboxy-7-deazaguanine synthase (Cx14CxxC type)